MLSSDMYQDDISSRMVNDGDDGEDCDNTNWITSTSTSASNLILTIVKLRRGATPYGGIRLTDTCNHDGLTDVGSG